MNWSEMQAQWGKLGGTVIAYWTKVTASDLYFIDGSRDRLAEVLCDRYDIGPDEAEAQIAAFEKDSRLPGAVK